MVWCFAFRGAKVPLGFGQFFGLICFQLLQLVQKLKRAPKPVLKGLHSCLEFNFDTKSKLHRKMASQSFDPSRRPSQKLQFPPNWLWTIVQTTFVSGIILVASRKENVCEGGEKEMEAEPSPPPRSSEEGPSDQSLKRSAPTAEPLPSIVLATLTSESALADTSSSTRDSKR